MESKKLYFFDSMVTFVDYTQPDHPYITYYNQKLDTYGGKIIDITGDDLTFNQFEALKETPPILLGAIEALYNKYGEQ